MVLLRRRCLRMKKVLLVVSLFLFGSTCWADNYSANFKIQTGDAALDLHLSNVNAKAATPAGANEVKSELQANYSVSEKQISFLAKQGYTLAEIQHLALLAKQSGKTIDQVAALHGKGVGCGLLAKRLGIQPSALRKLIVAQKKEARKEMMHPEALP